MPSGQLSKQLEIKHLILTFLILFALMASFLYTLLLILKQPLLTAVSLIVILTLIWLWRKGEVSRAAWLLLAWFASIWAVSALLGVVTVEFFQATAGYVLLLSALTSTTSLAISGIIARRRKTVDQLIKEALEQQQN
jgi:glucan phosphoethanolaminetransferase (alkaline phosphatase superfamily)